MAEQRREDMRAADSDRQFVADRLRDALNEGRLDLGEYDDRLKEAYAARTYGELDKLLDDLPTVVPPERSQVATTAPTGTPRPATGRRGMPPWLWATWGGWVTTSLICFVVWALTGMGYPWPLWIAGPWGAVLLARTIGAFSSGDPEGHLAAELDEHARRDERDRQRRRERRERRRDR